MQKKGLKIARVLCIVGMVAITAFAFVRLYVFSQRADLSILLLNVVLFAAIAGVLVYVSKKEKEIEEDETFRD